MDDEINSELEPALILTMPFHRNTKVNFSRQTGKTSAVIGDSAIVGNMHDIDGNNVALYAESGQLLLQIDALVWILSAADVTVKYHHLIQQGKSHFSITSPNQEYALDYPAWWAGIPDFMPVEPERDADEDYLAYVYTVWQSPALQRVLLNKWKS